MRRSMRLSVLALMGLAAVALTAAPALAGDAKRYRDYDRHGAHTVVIEKHKHGHRNHWRHRHHHRGRTVVVVKQHRPVTRVIVREERRRHHHHHHHRDRQYDPLAHLLGRVLVGAVADVLENGRSGRAVAWRNPDNGAVATVTPVRTYQTASGAYCREYQTTGSIGGYEEDLYGTACRQPDGSWLRVQ